MSKLNENRPGYKKTKVGWIPEEWECVRLTLIVNGLHAGVSVNSYDDRAQGSELGVLKTSAVTYGYFDSEQNKRIRENEKDRARIAPVAGSVIVSRMNTKELVGANAYIEKDFPTLRLPDRLWQMKVKDESKNNPLWLGFLMSSQLLRSKLSSLATGTSGSMKNITKQDVLALKIPQPPLTEQKKISEMLSAWERAIDQLGKLINAKTELKKALMQQLLSGKWKFKKFKKDEWVKMKLLEFLKSTSRPVPRPDKEYVALGIRSHGKGTFLRTVDNPEDVMMDTLYEVKENDLIVNITFAWEGAIAFVKQTDEGALVSHRFPIHVFKKDKVTPEYFRHVILTKWFVHQLKLISPGGAGRNRVMSKKDFLNLAVNIPSLPEQQKIAAVLNSIDHEINLLDNQLTALKEQKKGLMQKLLTGMIRVKV